MSWPSVKLADVATIERKGIDPSEIASGTEYLGLEHIESGGRILSFQTVANGELASTKFHFGPNHILYGKLRPYLAKIAMPDFEGVCSTDILPINPGPSINRKFLAYFLRQPSMVDFATSRSTGANLPRLSPKALADFEIPLPPLEEQKRIAAILDQADRLRRLRQRAIDRLNTLGQAIFYEMFGDLEEIDGERLGDHTTKIGSGATPKGGGAAYKSSGIPLVRSMNVKDGYFDLEGLAFIDETQARKLDNVILRENDILLNITGASVARVCRAPDSVASGRVNQHVSIIRPTDSIQPEFLEAFLLLPNVKRKLLTIAESGATRQAITKSQIEELQVPVPELPRQMEFVRRKRGAISIQVSANLQCDRLTQLFSSLQHRAFRGEL